MEGTTHASTGLLLGAGAALFLHATAPAAGAHLTGAVATMQSAGGDVLFGAVVAGFALLPDADHPDASFAHSAGWLSRMISHVVTVLFGGHRQGMHSAAGVVAMCLATAACTLWFPNRWSLGCLAVMMTLCIAAGMTAIGVTRRSGSGRRRKRGPFEGAEHLVIGAAVSAVMLYVPAYRADLWWLVALGMTLHIFEDSLTGHGVAIAWPFTRRRFGGDGRQPAARRPVTRGPRDARPPQEPPVRPRRGPSKPACPACWMGECGQCTDRGCGCPQAVHPARPKRKSRAAAPDADEPLVVVKNTGPDIPPF